MNDAVVLRRCLRALRSCARADTNEIVIADGGASDESRALAEEFGTAYIRSERGRGAQMNHAATVTRGNWIWFLHADCVPSPQSLDALNGLDARSVWGCFRHRIDAPSPWLRIIEAADNLRARAASLPYGDQGLFVRADVFRAVGGFDAVPLLEDVLLARKLAQFGSPRVLKPLLRTDARRWLRNGILKTTLLNWRTMFGFLMLRKSPKELARDYVSPHGAGATSPGPSHLEKTSLRIRS